MKTWVTRARGGLAMGLRWAVVCGAGGVLVMLAFLLFTGSRPDPPFPLMAAAAGFAAGFIFSFRSHKAVR